MKSMTNHGITAVGLVPMTNPVNRTAGVTTLRAGDSRDLGRTNLAKQLVQAMKASTRVSIHTGEEGPTVEFGIVSAGPSRDAGQLMIWIELAESSDLQLGEDRRAARAYLEVDTHTGATMLHIWSIGTAQVVHVEPTHSDVIAQVRMGNIDDFWVTDPDRYAAGDYVTVRVVQNRLFAV
jgi:hypothetical protein